MSLKSLQGRRTENTLLVLSYTMYDCRNRWVLRRFLKVDNVDAVRMSDGRLFHAAGEPSRWTFVSQFPLWCVSKSSTQPRPPTGAGAISTGCPSWHHRWLKSQQRLKMAWCSVHCQSNNINKPFINIYILEKTTITIIIIKFKSNAEHNEMNTL